MLLLGADEKDFLAGLNNLGELGKGCVEGLDRLLEINDVRVAALAMDVWRHLGVPTARLVPKMSTRFEQSLHIDIYCHMISFLFAPET